MEPQKYLYSQRNPDKKNNIWGIAVLDFKIACRAKVIKKPSQLPRVIDM